MYSFTLDLKTGEMMNSESEFYLFNKLNIPALLFKKDDNQYICIDNNSKWINKFESDLKNRSIDNIFESFFKINKKKYYDLILNNDSLSVLFNEEYYLIDKSIISQNIIMLMFIKTSKNTNHSLSESYDYDKELKNQADELEKNLLQQEIISQISISLNKKGNIKDKINQALSKLGILFDVSRIYIFEDSSDGNYTTNTFEWCNSGISPEKDNLINIPYNSIPSYKIMLNSGYIFSENIKELPEDVYRVLEPQNIKSVLMFPLLDNNKSFGFIGFDECNINKRWTKNDISHLKTLSGVFSNAILREKKDKRLKKTKEKLENIVNSTKTGIWEFNIKSNIVQFNNIFYEFLGVKEENNNFRSVDYIEKYIHPDDITIYQNDLKNHFQNPGKFFSTEIRFKHISGIYKWLFFYGKITDFDQDGSPSKMFGITLDISSKKLMEMEKNKYLMAIQNIGDSIIITDKEGYIEYVNPAFLNISGYSLEEVIGKHTRLLKSGIQEDSVYKKLWKTILKGNPWSGELVSRKKDGDFHTEDVKITPIFDSYKEISNFIAIKHDITQRKEAEKEIKEKTFLLDLFFSQSLDGFFFMLLENSIKWDNSVNKEQILDYVFKNQKITRINKAMLEQYKAKETDFIGSTPEDFFQHDIEQGKKIWKDFFDKGTLHIDTQEKRFDGTDIIVEGDYIVIKDEHNRIKGHFGIQRDVTVQRKNAEKIKKSENMLRQITETIGEVFWLNEINVKTGEAKTLYISPSFEKIWGLKVEKITNNIDLIYKTIHPEDIDIFKKATIENPFEFDIEYRIINSQGQVRWIHSKVYPVKGYENNEEIKRLSGISEDITDKKTLELKLKELSTKDTFLNILNRKNIMQTLDIQLKKYNRTKTNFSVCLIDLDHFKNINDNYGHQFGDKVLLHFVAAVKSIIRPYDIIGRYGGEEFLLIFENTSLKDAVNVLKRIKTKLIKDNVLYQGKNLKYTFSAGVSDMNSVSKNTIKDIIEDIDKKLYFSKENGRDQITS